MVYEENIGYNLLESEVVKSIKEMENWKATGRGEIQIELIKASKRKEKKKLIRE